MLDTEEIALKHLSAEFSKSFQVSRGRMNETFRVHSDFAPAAFETRILTGKFHLPVNFQPTFAGRFAHYDWQIRARVETTNVDCDPGFQPFFIGAVF